MNTVDVTDGDVTVTVKSPTRKDKDAAHLVFVSAWRSAVEGKAMLREKLNDYLIEQGLWDDDKQAKYEKMIDEISDKAAILTAGGIPFRKAKEIAFELKKLREELRDLIAVRTSYDQYTAEGVADNTRFDYLVTLCVLDPVTRQPVFKDLDDYNERGAEPWAIKAASQLASFLYNLDPNYEKNLEENKFLEQFNLIDDKGRLINKDGHLIAVDNKGVERLINEDGEYVAYDEKGVQYKVNRNGKKVEKTEQLPFTDDDGNPL